MKVLFISAAFPPMRAGEAGHEGLVVDGSTAVGAIHQALPSRCHHAAVQRMDL